MIWARVRYFLQVSRKQPFTSFQSASSGKVTCTSPSSLNYQLPLCTFLCTRLNNIKSHLYVQRLDISLRAPGNKPLVPFNRHVKKGYVYEPLFNYAYTSWLPQFAHALTNLRLQLSLLHATRRRGKTLSDTILASEESAAATAEETAGESRNSDWEGACSVSVVFFPLLLLLRLSKLQQKPSQ